MFLEITYSYWERNELTRETTYVVIWNDETQEEEWVYVSGWYYGYDLRGNLASKADVWGIESWYYTWSADDKLTQVDYYYDDYENPWSRTVEYKYDLLGRRVAKRVSLYGVYGEGTGPWRWYFYDGLKLIAEGTGQNDKIYYTDSPGAIGGIICRDASTGGGQKLWYHYDRLGNVMAVTDANGNPYVVYTMEAFGSVLEKGTSTGYYSEHATDPQPYHITIKEHDPDTGLYYFNARWYDSTVGRFVSRDPVTRGSQYSLCGQAPVNGVDPTGLWGTDMHHWITEAWCNQVARGHSGNAAVTNRVCHCVGSADDDFDRIYYPGNPFFVGLHFRIYPEFYALMEQNYNKAFNNCSCMAFGHFLHQLQDSVAHGDWPFHWPVDFDDVNVWPDEAWETIADTKAALEAWWSNCKCSDIQQ